MPRESRLVSRIIAECERRGAWTCKLHGGPYQAAGLPDLVVVWQARTLWFEAKTPDGELTPIQRRQHDLMRAAGAEVHLVRSVADVIAILDA